MAERAIQSLADRLLDLDGQIADNEIRQNTHEFVESMKNQNTKSKTKSDMNIVRKWCESVNETRELFDIPTAELHCIKIKYKIKYLIKQL